MLYITNIESNIASILNILAMNTPKKIEFSYLPQLDSLSSFDAIVNLLDEKATRRTIEAVNWREQFPYQPLTTFTAAHSGKNIYIDFFVRCNFLRAENFTNQSKVSEDSCVEFFVEPVPGGEYWNFEFNCIGTVNASHRIEGIFTWNLLVVIPLDLIGVEYKGEALKMRGNFYKCASAASQPHYLSWNPIDTPAPDFHRPEFFGDIILL